MKRPLQLPLAIALALGGTNVLALGLGPVHVKSRLNQPLDAEIPIIQGTADEAEGLLVSLAGAEDFERIGLDRSHLNVPLEFTIVKGSGGQPVIRVTSKEPIRETFLDFLVEANWPKGRLLREYTVLLDPPLTAPARTGVAAAPAPARAGGSGASTQPLRETRGERAAAATAAPAPRSAPTPRSAPAPRVQDGQYGPVESGQTLSGIARSVSDGADLNRMMLAIYKANPDAFYKANINALKRGAILRLPGEDEIAAVGSAREAAAQVQAQVEDWRGGAASPTRVADAGAVPAEPSARPARTGTSAKATTAAAGERLELVPPKAGRDSLAMADRPGSGESGTAASAALRSELARAKEALTTRDQETGELKSRVEELEDLKEKNNRLLSLKNSEIAELQRKLAELREQQTAAAKAPAATAPTAAPGTTPTTTPTTTTPSAGMAGEAPAASTGTEAADAAGSAPATADTAPVAATATPAGDTTAPVDRKDIWGEAGTAGEPGPGAAGEAPTTPPDASATTAGGEVATATSPEPATPADATAAQGGAETTPLADAGSTPPPGTEASPGNTGGAVVTPLPSTPVDSSGTPAASSNGPAGADATAPATTVPWYEAPWVKPAALGAGVLLVLLGLLGLRRRNAPVARASIAHEFGDSPFGDSRPPEGGEPSAAMEAEAESLREQLRQQPANLGLHLELLSLYYAERDLARFEEEAEEMHVYVDDPHQPEWLEAQAMGQELAPHNPLFADAPQYGDDDALVATSQIDPDAETLERPAFDVEGTRDTEFGDFAATAPPAGASTSGDDFGFATDAFPATPPVDEPPAAPQDVAADSPFDFTDLPPLEPDAPATGWTEPADEPAGTTSLGVEDFPGEDAIGTKLDLARAYLDMGDPEGARSMLEEVVAEGSEEQKAEAHRLMADMG
jgi:pilus assembly protein FimV